MTIEIYGNENDLQGLHLYAISTIFFEPGQESFPDAFGEGLILHWRFFWHASTTVCNKAYCNDKKSTFLLLHSPCIQ